MAAVRSYILLLLTLIIAMAASVLSVVCVQCSNETDCKDVTCSPDVDLCSIVRNKDNETIYRGCGNTDDCNKINDAANLISYVIDGLTSDQIDQLNQLLELNNQELISEFGDQEFDIDDVAHYHCLLCKRDECNAGSSS